MATKSARRLLAENLRIHRVVRGWSQEALAEAAGLDRSFVGGIERGERNVSLDNLEKLAAALNMTIPELLQSPDPNAVGEQLLGRLRAQGSTGMKE